MFSVFAVLASFGIGNMGQINKIVINLDSANYVDRRIKHKDVEPVLSYDPSIQAEHAKDVELE